MENGGIIEEIVVAPTRKGALMEERFIPDTCAVTENCRNYPAQCLGCFFPDDALGPTQYIPRDKTIEHPMTTIRKAELAKPTGLLSVTSMNQLVHNPAFSVTASDISSLFNNIFPLLEALNQ